MDNFENFKTIIDELKIKKNTIELFGLNYKKFSEYEQIEKFPYDRSYNFIPKLIVLNKKLDYLNNSNEIDLIYSDNKNDTSNKSFIELYKSLDTDFTSINSNEIIGSEEIFQNEISIKKDNDFLCSKSKKSKKNGNKDPININSDKFEILSSPYFLPYH